jgi:hypothetical protein
MKFWELSGNKLAFSGVLAFILLSGMILVRVGIFSIDESTILLGFDGLSKSGKLKIFNDYETYKVPELNSFKGIVNEDELFVKYPPLYFYLALPIFVAFGPFGLILINLIAAIISLIIFFRLATDITGSESLSLKAVLLLVFTTFFFEYSIAIWPHMLAMMLTLVAIYLFRTGITGEGLKEYMFFYSGLFLGVALGVRSSSLIVIVLLVFLMIWEKHGFFRRFGLLMLGIYPPLGFISFINYYRFNSINPFANDVASRFDFQSVNYLVPIIVILTCLFAIYLHYYLISLKNRELTENKDKERRKKYFFIAFIAISSILILLPILFYFKYFSEYVRNFLAYVMNSYFVPRFPFEGATFVEPGIITYGGIIKKALLQSCPFLILIFTAPYILGKYSEFKRTDKRLISLFCFGIPLFYSFFNFHGGMGFNSRYFLELLPWGVLIVVLWLEKIKIGGQFVEVFVFMVVLFALIFSFTQDLSLASMLIVAFLPSLLALLLIINIILNLVFSRFMFFKTIFSFLIVISLALGFSLAYFKDLPSVLSRRSENIFKAKIVEKTVPERAFLFVYWGYKDSMAMVKLKKPIIVADYNLSPRGNPFPFLEKALSSGIPVYLYGEGIHPELMEVFKVEFDVNDVSSEIIPVYQIKRRGKVF